MQLETIKLPKHFYMYCALIHANNRTLGFNDAGKELSRKIVNVLEKLNIKKLTMPMHSYHYLMGMLNLEGYEDNGRAMKPIKEVLDYVAMLSSIPELQIIWKED